MTDPVLDRAEVSQALFYPRPEEGWETPAPGILPVGIQVEPGIRLGGRLHTAGVQAPLIVLFHGNGEIAADYDDLGPLYNRLGISLLVIDYRGYGASDGQPTAGNLLADTVAVFQQLDDLLAGHGLAPAGLYAMGRSLGSAAAVEAASHAGERLAGIIVESGFADTFALLARLGLHVRSAGEAADGFDNAGKLAHISTPLLIIHGGNDILIPPADGQELYRRSAAADKRLVLISGAGHNDLLWAGREAYFDAIAAFVAGHRPAVG